MIFEVYVTNIEYGSATIEADSEEEAKKKIYNDEVEIFYHSSEISDAAVESIKE